MSKLLTALSWLILFAVLFGSVTGNSAWAESHKVADYLPAVTPQMLAYSHTRYALYFIWILVDASASWLFLQLGFSNKLRQFAENKSKFLFIQIAIFVLLFALFYWIITSPLQFFTSFWLEQHYGLSSQPISGWLSDQAKHFAVALAIEIPIWWMLYKLMRSYSRIWPWLLFAASVPLIVFIIFIEPIAIDPLFNRYTPMPPGIIRNGIEILEQRAGIDQTQTQTPIFVVDKSKQTNKINAYVTGIGGTARVVIWDNTLRRLPNDQLFAVVAHELGHYVLKHVYYGCAIAIAISLALVPINYYLAGSFFSHLPKSWGIKELQDFAGIPVIMLISVMVSFIADPAFNAFSRYIEHQADAFALKLTGNGPALARTFVSLAQDNLSEPEPPPFIEFWLFSHPSLKHRIEFALGQ